MQSSGISVTGSNSAEHLCGQSYRTVTSNDTGFSHHNTVVVAAFVSSGTAELFGLCLCCIVAYEHFTFHDGYTASNEVVIASDMVCAFAFLD